MCKIQNRGAERNSAEREHKGSDPQPDLDNASGGIILLSESLDPVFIGMKVFFILLSDQLSKIR
jgi:hypothetical protein